MNRHEVLIEDTGERYACREDRHLLEGMEALGRRGVPVGCRSGGCGVCKVRIEAGTVRTRVMSREHVSVDEQAQGIVLACRAYPLEAMRLSVIGAMRKNVCRGAEPARPAPAAPPSPNPTPAPPPAPARQPGRWVSPEPKDSPHPIDPWSLRQLAHP